MGGGDDSGETGAGGTVANSNDAIHSPTTDATEVIPWCSFTGDHIHELDDGEITVASPVMNDDLPSRPRR